MLVCQRFVADNQSIGYFCRKRTQKLQDMANNLMFEVGVKEAGKQLTELENRLKKIVSTYGKLELKVQVDGLKAFTSALENIGQSKGLEALQKRIDVLQVTLANVGMSGAKSIQEFEAAVKTTSAVADQYTQRINKMTEARDRLTKGTESWNRIDAQLTNFQNDKQVLAIYAQEQVAIKNLEDAKTRLSNKNTQEAESYQKVITSIETLSNAANTLKTVLGSWDPNKGSIVQLVEQFEKLHKEIAAIASELKGIDPSKLNLSGLNINVGSIAGLGDLNSAIRGLEVSINDIIRLFSNLANAVKLQPLDDQMKALLERCERAEAKLREVGEAARYLNEQNGARTHQKSQNIAGIAGLNEENVEKVSNLFERYRKLLADVQNQTANLGGIQNVAEKLGLNPTIVDQAAKRFEALWKTIENSMVGMERYKGFPVLDQSSDQLAKLRAEFSALLSEYKLVTQEANNYNKAQQKIITEEEKRAAILTQLQGPATKVNLVSEQNVQDTLHRIDAIGAAYTRLQKLLSDMGDWGKAPRSAMEMALGGNWNKYQGDYAQQMSVFRDTLNRIKTEIDEMSKAGMNIEGPKQQLDALYVTLEKLSSLKDIDLGKKLGLEHLRGYTGPSSAADDITWASMKRQAEVQEVAGEAAKRHQKKLEELTNAFEAHDAQVAKSQRVQEGDNKARQASVETLRRQAEELVRARKQMLQGQANELTKLLTQGKDNLSAEQYTAVKNALRGVREEMRQIEGVMQRMGSYSLRDLFNIGRGGMNYAPLISNANSEIQKNKKEKEENDKATTKLTDSEKRFADAIQHSTDSMKGQSQVLSDLKMLATQYLSVWGAQSFIQNIIQTGGLLEQQRLSIGAILQNAGQATELFDKIKALAVQSPFGVVELDKMSKQLTAYGFEYKELYDWTKRLGDISAATGTGVDRLALALGHVRSEGALSGYTLRQFAMGNVPLLRMLSENLGISTKQVREKVRKKEVSYDDVMKVLRQLTDEGGMFYQAQETMSQALNAKFKNLHDAFDIMYGEIAESGVGDTLKRLAEILTAGAKEWGRYAKDIMGVAAAFGIAKAAMWAYNVAHAKGLHTSLTAIAAAAKEERQNLRLANTYRDLTAAEQAALGPKNALVRAWYGLFAPMKLVSKEQLAVAISTKKLTQEDLLRAVAMRKVNIEQAKAAILASKLSRAQKANMIGALNNVTVLGKWRIALIGLGNAMKGVLSIAKTFAPLMAITAIMDMFARVSEMKSQASEASSALAEKAASDLKVLNDTFKDLLDNGYLQKIQSVGKYIGGKRVEVRAIEFNDEYLKSHDLTHEIEELKSKLQDMSPMYEGDLVDIDKMDNQVEQFKALVNKLESIRHANDVTEAMSDVVTNADVNIAGKNWFTRMFGDTYTTDVKDYENMLKQVEKEVLALNEKTINTIDKELGGRLTEMQKKYSLDSKNNALTMIFADWARKGGVPDEYRDKLVGKEFKSIASPAWNRPLQQQYEQLKEDTKEMAETMASIVKNQFDKDPEGAMYAINNYIKKLMSMAKATDPRVIQEATNMLLDATRKNLPKNMQGPVIDEMQRKMVIEQFMGLLGETITESTTPEEAEKALKKYQAMAIKWGEQMGFDMERIGMLNAEKYREGLQAKLNQVAIKVDWQKRASKVFEVNTVLKTNIDKNIDEFAQAVQKDLKEKQDYLTRNAKHLKALKLPIKIDMDILMNAKKLKDLIEKLSLTAFSMAVKGDAKGARALYSKVNDELKPFYNALVSVQEDKTWLKQENYPETDPTKGKKGSQEDKNAKAVREQVRVIKEAADAFQYWREKVGDKGAWEHVQSEFGTVLNDIKITAKNIEDVRGNLKKIPQSDAFKKIKDQKIQTEIKKEIAKDDDQFIRKDFERDTEKFLSKTQLELDNLTRAWDTFNSVREATGDVELAKQLSGAEYETGRTRNLADALKEKIQKDLSGIKEGITIDFNINFSDEQIQREVENAFEKAKPVKGNDESEEAYKARLTKYQSQIKGIVEATKKWRDLQRDVLKSSVSSFAKILGSVDSYKNRLNKITDEYKKQRDELDADLKNEKITPEQYKQADDIIKSKEDMDKWKISTEYINLMNNSLVMTRSEIEAAAAAQEELLNKALSNGTIKMEEFMSEMMKLQNIRKEWSTEGFFGIKGGVGAFLSGGYDSLTNYYKNRSQRAYQEYSNAENKESPEAQAKLEEAKHYENLYVQLVELSQTAKQVVTSFQMLNSAVDMVADLFDALGMDSASNTTSDAGGILGGMLGGASSLSALGPYGMAAGAVLGGLTSIAQLHDKGIQREIDALQDHADSLKENTEAIKAARERTLGYDNGRLRQAMSQQYKDIQRTINVGFITGGEKSFVVTDEAKKAMQEYYKKNSGMSGYAAELENLKAMREDYIEMYNLEESKKKSSQDALNEYKSKIAELDDQIMYFVEDLANELWGIDFESWASQISDALWTAFENGEDALDAFHDAAKDIISDVAKRMMNIHLIEPKMAELEEQLFGKIDSNGKRTGGVYNMSTGQFDEQETLRILGKFFGEDGEFSKVITSAEDFYKMAERVTGMDLSSKDSSSSASSSIKGITEQTADLLASYLNAVRSDVSVNRFTLQQILEAVKAQSGMTLIAESQVKQLEQIASNTKRNADAADRIYDVLHASQTGSRRLEVQLYGGY